MSTMRRVAVVAAVSIICIGSINRAFKAQKVANSDRRNSALFAIRTPARKDCGVTPYTIADRLGFLAEEGLRIQWTRQTQPSLLIPSIVRGDIDVSEFPPNTLAVAKAGEAPITGVAEAGIEPEDSSIDPKYRSVWWFINPERLPNVKSFADVGRSVTNRKIKFTTSNPNIDGSDFESKLLASSYRIPINHIEWVSIPDVQAIEALKLGHVDVSAVHSHFYVEMEKAGARKIADSLETGLGRAAGITYWTFHDRFIKEHPDKAAAWVRALRRAQAWANSNPEGARKFTAEAIGQPVTGNQYYSESKGVDGELAARWLNDLVQSGLIPAGKVTTRNLVTQQIATINESIYASRDRLLASP
jgi:ABC-type nitrate/sulfonate/bicarbonate transport system substrate-binding protein